MWWGACSCSSSEQRPEGPDAGTLTLMWEAKAIPLDALDPPPDSAGALAPGAQATVTRAGCC